MTSRDSTRSPGASASPLSRLWTLALGSALLRFAGTKRGVAPAGTGRERLRQYVRSNRVPARDPGRARPRGGSPGRADNKDEQRQRGREAESPSEIPAKGWKDILWRVYEEINNDRVLSVAAGVTFYSLLALFPGIAAFISLYGLFADPATVNDHLNAMSGILPGGALEVIGEQVKRITSKPGGALGFAFFTGLAISLWSANAGMKALFDALNIVYDEDERRGFFKLNLVSLSFTLGAIVMIGLAIAAVVVLPIVFKFIGLGAVFEWLLAILRWPVLLALILLGLACLYRFGPSRDTPEWRWVTWGGGVAAALWIVGSMLFSWYVSNFGNYNETYGSLGAAIGFMTWIWLSTTIVLIGGEINAEMEHQTKKDTTTGPDRPLGTRGAKMADQVGAAKA